MNTDETRMKAEDGSRTIKADEKHDSDRRLISNPVFGLHRD
jgi:hypothetical protein